VRGYQLGLPTRAAGHLASRGLRGETYL